MDFSRVTTPIKQHKNPQYFTPSTTQRNPFERLEADSLQSLRYMLEAQQFRQALQLVASNEVMEGLVLDHIEVAFFGEALFSHSVDLDFSILSASEARQARVSELLSLRRTRGINSTVLSRVSSSLEEIIAGTFSPFTSLKHSRTQIFQQLYSKLNEIAQALDKSRGSGEAPAQQLQTARELLGQQVHLEGKVKRAEEQLSEYQHKEISLYRQILSLKAEVETLRSIQLGHEGQKLQLARQFSTALMEKHQQYRRQLEGLAQTKNSSEGLLIFENELEVSIQDFKDLILKLSRENRLLKEEKESLLSKLSLLEQRCLLMIKLSRPLSQQSSELGLLEELQLKMGSLEGEMEQKKVEMRQLEDELGQLRRFRLAENSLDRSGSAEGKKEPKFKRIQSNEQGEKVSELKQLMKKDQKMISSLTETIEELRSRLEGRATSSKETQENTLNGEHSLQTRWKDGTISSQGGDGSSVLPYKQYQGASEEYINIDLIEPVTGFDEFQKPNEMVMTPRMLFDIVELKEQIEVLEKEKKMRETITTKQANQFIIEISRFEEEVERLKFDLQEISFCFETEKEKHEETRLNLEDERARYSKLLREKQAAITSLKGQHQLELSNTIKATAEEHQQLLLEKEAAKQQLEKFHRILTGKLAHAEDMQAAAERRVSELELKAQQLQRKYRSLAVEKEFYSLHPSSRQATLFHGEIMPEHPFQNQFLIETLETRLKSRIRRTSLLWKYDPRNRTNFHEYLDSKERWVLLIELKDSYILGGYSEGRLYPKMVSEKDGILFSLSRKEVFEPVEENKGVVKYDEYYIIFGNSEIRVKSQDDLLFSNFGSPAGCFRAKGNKASTMTNCSQKEARFQRLEVHQIQLLQ